MDATSWQRAQEIFDQAIQMPAAKRAALVNDACAGDRELRREVEKLLGAHEEAGEFLSSPTVAASTDPVPEEREGAQIGPYKLLQRIGEGGFATVYMAEQRTPVVRKVAVKIIKPGMGTEQVIARFEAERQALAMMDHPNIARVFDAGAAESGRPYFVMELVRGAPISEYCDQNNLTLRQRLELCVQVCHAVQHAHTKGIIHRDIKPSNVLVASHDGVPVPKVIDFGIAKAMHFRLTDKTVFTEFRQLIGTPAYMSPEQAELSGLDIDTRSDVYSLGVLLYELLTGQTPFDSQTLREAPFDELRRIICEEEPPKPSTRFSSMLSALEADPRPGAALGGSSVIDIAAHRHTDPSSLTRSLRGDLDWIVMKCLEKDRARRYQSASALADDVQRHLTNQPILARPPSAIYQFKKLVARHKVPFAFIAALLVLTVGSSIWMTVLYGQAGAERDRAGIRLAETEVVTEFFTDMLAAVDPGEEGEDATVRQVLDQSSRNVGDKFKDKPLVEARLRTTIGRTYQALGKELVAESHMQRSLDILRQHLGEEHADTLSAMNDLGALWGQVNNRGLLFDPRAEPMLAETLETSRLVLGDEHPVTLTATNHMAWIHAHWKRYEDAEELFLQALQTRKRVLGEYHPDTLTSMDDLAEMYDDQGRHDEAERLYVQALAGRKRILGESHPQTLESVDNLANLYRYLRRYDEAEVLYTEQLEILKPILGEMHVRSRRIMGDLGGLYSVQRRYDEAETVYLQMLEIGKRIKEVRQGGATLDAMHSLARLYARQRRYAEAEPFYLQCLEAEKLAGGEECEDTLFFMYRLAVMYHLWARYDKAESLYLQVIETNKRVEGEEPLLPQAVGLRQVWRAGQIGSRTMQTLTCMDNLARVYKDWGRYDKAEALYLELMKIEGFKKDFKADVTGKLADLYSAWGRYDQAESFYLQALEFRKRVNGEEHRHTLVTMNQLASLCRDTGRYEKGEQLYLQTLEIMKRTLGEEHHDTLAVMSNLCSLYILQGRYDEAEPLLAQAVAGLRRVRGDSFWRTGRVLMRHGVCLSGLKRYDEAEAALLEACETLKNARGEAHQSTLTCKSNLGDLYTKMGRYTEAEPLLAQAVAGSKEKLPEHWRTGLFLMRHGVCLAGLERFDAAAAALLEAHDILKSARGTNHEQTTEAIKAIADLYDAWNAAEPGKGYDAKATEWRAKIPDIEPDAASP